jgi:hypothetical protein
VKAQERPTPAWLRVVAAIGVAAFFLLFIAGIFGYYDGWLAASVVFVVAFGAVWVHKLLNDKPD